MSVWVTIPSARPAAEVQPWIEAWQSMGYRVALWRDEGSEPVAPDYLFLGSEYPGYARAVNVLTRIILEEHPECTWCTIGGDDTFPDPHKRAGEISIECEHHFLAAALLSQTIFDLCASPQAAATFGVMQPVGDRYAGGSIDRIAGSAWMGREWCRRVNGGRGPLWPEYEHMFLDEEVRAVAIKLGVYWTRPDLVQLHRHFMRESDAIDSPAVPREPPPHLARWNTADHWHKSQELFRARRAAGFPGHEVFLGTR